MLRRIEAGQLPGATLIDNVWSIGVEDLLAAGLHPGRGTPVREDARGASKGLPEPEYVRRIAELERDLVIERTKRAAAEQIAADRGEHIIDLRRSFLMLEAGRPAPSAEPVGVVQMPAEPVGVVQLPAEPVGVVQPQLQLKLRPSTGGRHRRLGDGGAVDSRNAASCVPTRLSD